MLGRDRRQAIGPTPLEFCQRLGIRFAVPRPRPEVRVAQAMQQPVDRGERTQQLELFGQDSLKVFAAKRTDQLTVRWPRFDPRSKRLLLLGREGPSRLLPPPILQAGQAFLVITGDPTLADAS